MPKLLILILLVVLLCGCAAVLETIGGIKKDPAGFQKEAQANTIALNLLFPIGGAAVGAGYGLAFLRRLYVNRKRKEALNAK